MSRKKPKVTIQRKTDAGKGNAASKSLPTPFPLRSFLRLRRVWVMCAAVVLSIGVAACFPWILGRLSRGPDQEAAMVIALGFAAFFFVPAAMLAGILLSVASPYGRGAGTKSARVILCILGYGATVLIFASGYFVIQVTGDHYRAVTINRNLKIRPTLPESTRVSFAKVIELGDKSLPLRGIKYKAFVAVHEYFGDGGLVDISEDYIEQLAESASDRPPRMKAADDCAALWMECLHYSIVTAATVGYGDISPDSIFAKIVTDCQIVSSTIMLVFSFGLILSGGDRSVSD